MPDMEKQDVELNAQENAAEEPAAVAVNAEEAQVVGPESNKGDRNEIILRGVVLAIRQDYREERERTETYLTMRSYNVGREGVRTPVGMNVFWNNNADLLNDVRAGDHVKVTAECGVYNTLNSLYGTAIDKLERDGEFGLGEYPTDMNECVFVGDFDEFDERPEQHFAIVRLTIPRVDGRRNQVSIALRSAGVRLFKDNADKFAVGKKIGVIGRVYLPERELERAHQRVRFSAVALIAIDDEGNYEVLSIPNPVRRPPRPRRNAPRRRVDAETTAREDLRHPDPEAPSLSDEELNAQAPAAEDSAANDNEELTSGLSVDEVLARNQQKAMERMRNITQDE